MNIPITSRVKRAPKNGCGCESAAKMWGAAKVAHGEKSSPAKQAAYPKALKEQVRNTATREERDSIIDSHIINNLSEQKPLSRVRTKALEKAKQRRQVVDTIAQKNCYGKKK